MSQLPLHILLEKAAQKGASDLHLVSNKHPIYRIHGELFSDQEAPVISATELKQILFEILVEKQKDIFLRTRELDFSYKSLSGYQFRINIHMEKGNIAATARITPSAIASLEQLGLPPIINSLTNKRKGLVMLAGTAGSGKSTTMTYMIDRINRERKCKIVTIEDPIEYVHESKQSLIIQREVGSDTDSFASALKYALRQDPDVVVVGEMRDPESISMALTTAETGHLVMSTVHAPDAVETLNRIIDAYGAAERDQICTQLASNVLAIIYQVLVPRKDGQGRILATEILLGSMAVRNLIRRKDFVEIRGSMEADEESHMHTLETCLSELARKDLITEDTARMYARMPSLLKLKKGSSLGQAPQKDILTAKPSQASAPKEAEPLAAENKDIKILLIDGKQNECAGMARALSLRGYAKISAVERGKEGLEKLQAEHTDVAIIDTFLHDMDSFDLCRQIKHQCPHMKVILATSSLEASDAKNAEAAGADDFVIKTTNGDLVCRSVRKVNQKK
jgi:twitching motility protein PilT